MRNEILSYILRNINMKEYVHIKNNMYFVKKK